MKRRKKKRTTRPSMKETQPRGFDYGCLPVAMAVASLEFPTYLTSASVDAVAYGSRWSEAVNQEVPIISLVAKSGEELVKAFEEFHSWAKITDQDSVEITFVFRKTGGYLLVISTEYSRLMRRCLGFNRVYQAGGAGCIWCKPIDSVNRFLEKFRNYSSSPIAPFFFDGVTYVDPTNGFGNSVLPDVSEIPGLNPLLKFEITLVNEDEVTKNSTAWVAIKLNSQKKTQFKTDSKKPNPEDIAKLRAKTLRYHFPVTLERIRHNVSLQSTIQHLVFEGIQPWQRESYGWTAPEMDISGVEDEFWLATAKGMDRLIYIYKTPSSRDPRLHTLIEKAKEEVTIFHYTNPGQLENRVRDDLTSVISNRFVDQAVGGDEAASPEEVLNSLIPNQTHRIRRLDVEKALVARMNNVGRIVVTGPFGGGKTVLIAQLAEELGWIFVDGQGLNRLNLLARSANVIRKRLNRPPSPLRPNKPRSKNFSEIGRKSLTYHSLLTGHRIP